MRILTWNLFHGRSVPDSPRSLVSEFGATLAGWEWDVALLQECPPWWPASLARRCEAEERHVLTSRNGLLALRRAIAVRRPDLIRSNGGSCNAILVRLPGVVDHRVARLRWLPERRWVHAVRLRSGAWAANVHCSGFDADARRDGGRAAAAVRGWATGDPVLLGGDFNVLAPSVPGFALAGGHGVDHFMVSGWRVASGVSVLDGGQLSDHRPVALELD
ncbi:MAG TPA: endonuclease/exonuclease/phosphatase family protein [Solirubrobacteraceae bacterium]|nr:endonuclease/exonuclease/phosphatase family protein [Solirubrobacteraceae bacterium]